MSRHALLFLFLCASVIGSHAQSPREAVEKSIVEISVSGSDDGQPLFGAVVTLKSADSRLTGGVTDEKGIYRTPKALRNGSYLLRVTFVGYKPHERTLRIAGRMDRITVRLTPYREELEGLVVTARESKGMTSASVIGQDAMKHLQPSSFSDLLELLPGGLSTDPSLTGPNAIRLREARIPIAGSYNLLPRVSAANYATSSQGTAFVVDGIPIGTDAGMQTLSGAWDPKHTSREFVNNGVDLRHIGTDDIENVEIIRGIPSVEYSDLTSGLVKIKRKNTIDRLQARFKADMGSKLYYVGKGTNSLVRGMNIFGSVSLLDARSDPRNVYESYKRVTGSLRGTMVRQLPSGVLNWMLSMDYTGSFDDEKQDPDINHNNTDSFRSSYNKYGISQTLDYDRRERGWLSRLSWDSALSLTHESMYIERFMQLSHEKPYTDATTEGEHFGSYYPYSYTAMHEVDGRPLYFYSKVKGASSFDIGTSRHDVMWGMTWDYSKNIGKGAIFDIHKPVFLNGSTRPRAFKDIPARNLLSFFVEDRVSIPIGEHSLSLLGGVVTNTLMGLEQGYRMRGKMYTDLRANVRYSVAPITVRGHDLRLYFLIGAGTLSMMPSMLQLYPETNYIDLIELNYNHMNPDYRVVYAKTIIHKPNNKGLKPARNRKLELRADAEYGDYDMSVTYFRERMSDGFRPDAELRIVDYKRYDASHVDHDALTSAPDITTIPYKEIRTHALLGHTTNGSETRKEGIEWMLNTPRYDRLHTRVTFSGAWFRTVYKNSLPQYQKPSIILNNEELKYIGLYDDNEELISEVLNSDLRLDTFLPKLDLGFSVSFQCNWYSSAEKKPISAYPSKYYDLNGKEHEYSESAAVADTQLGWLKRNISASQFNKYTIPFMMSVNLKATKHLFDRKLRLAVFVNKIFDYSPDFEQFGAVIRRNQYPYFGMEINFDI